MLLPRLLGRVCLPAYLNSHLHLSRCMTTTASLDFTQYDSAQLAMMEEMCIVVDFDDAVIGEGTKKDVHLIDGVCMLPAGPPHRAFSVFLFDEQWRLLLQKRCSDKILFPLHWAASDETVQRCSPSKRTPACATATARRHSSRRGGGSSIRS